MRAIALLAFAASCAAHAAPASEESVEALLVATKVESLMDSMYAGMDQVMRQGMAQALQGKSLTPQERRALDMVSAKFVSAMREELGWQKLKPMYVQIYRETFEQEEVDGMLTFYASPSGQAMIAKMPVVMQKSMTLSQSLLQSLIPKMNAAMEQAMREAKNSGRK